VVILVAMASTRGDIHRAVIIFGAIVLGAAVAQYADFLFGRWMRGRHEAMKRVRVRDFAAAALAYWHPQLGSVYSTQCGAAGWTYGAFTTILLSTWLPWNVFWGVLMYTVGTLPVSDEQWDSLFTAYVVIWFAWEVVKYVRSGRQQDDIDRSEHPKLP
jgi:membrane protein DedA with SNARE-associated domain